MLQICIFYLRVRVSNDRFRIFFCEINFSLINAFNGYITNAFKIQGRVHPNRKTPQFLLIRQNLGAFTKPFSKDPAVE